MKNIFNIKAVFIAAVFKIAVIVAAAAVIVFSMAACNLLEDAELSGNITISPSGSVGIGTKLTATYSGSEKVSYQWKNGSSNVGSNTNEYIAETAGKYTVTVGVAGYKAKTSLPVTVTEGAAVDVFTSVAALKEWLDSQEENDLDSIYTVKLNVSALGGSPSSTDSVGSALNGEDQKFVHIDLSGSTFTSVDNWAFTECGMLAGITLPNTVTSIGDQAFYKCGSLESITIPNSVISIGQSAFSGCTSLTGVTIGNGVKSIGIRAFQGCASLTGIIIPDNVTSIGNNAFNSCAIESVTISNNVTSIEERTFANCAGLESITIPNSVTSIGDYAFSGCTGFTNITIPNSVISIGDFAFNGCTGLTGVTLGNNIRNIGEKVFDGYPCPIINVTSAVVLRIWLSAQSDNDSDNPYTVKLKVSDLGGGSDTKGSAGSALSYSENKFVNLDISGSTLTRIEATAFYDCINLTGITLPNSITSIGFGAFYGCENLLSVTIPNGVEGIEKMAFQNCAGITGVTIPDSVTDIYGDAFKGCTNLESVTFQGTINKKDFRPGAFSGDLYDKFYEIDAENGTPGTYATADGGDTWTKS
jgi:hypothetical protein